PCARADPIGNVRRPILYSGWTLCLRPVRQTGLRSRGTLGAARLVTALNWRFARCATRARPRHAFEDAATANAVVSCVFLRIRHIQPPMHACAFKDQTRLLPGLFPATNISVMPWD